MAPAAAAATPNIVLRNVRVPPGVTRPVVVDVHYPDGPTAPTAGNFRVLVQRVGPPIQVTRSLDTAGVDHAEVAGSLAATAIPGGRRFTMTGNNRVTIVHDAALRRFRITLLRHTAAELRAGVWQIAMLNFDVAPHPTYRTWQTLHPYPHEAPFFQLPPRSHVEHTFTRRERLVAGTRQDWDFHVPELRRRALDVEVVYQGTDQVQVAAVMPDGNQSGLVDAVPGADTPVPATASAVFAPAAATPQGVAFVRAGQVRITISNGPHPTAPGRRLARIRLEPDGDGRIPAGEWRIGLNPVAVTPAGNGVCEAWLPEMMYQRLSGTSMATPHVAGLAALLLQQDHSQTQDDIRRRLLGTARPVALVDGGRRQLPGTWDPAAGWGIVNPPDALLGHAGGMRHASPGLPPALGRVTGCPVACEDNCLLEATGPAGAPTGLRPARGAPHNRAPAAPGGDALPGCPRLDGYLTRYHSTAEAFTGAEGERFETARRTGLSQPLVREGGRGTLAGFRAVSWDEALRTLAERFVEQWADTGEVLILPARPDAGVVREVVLHRWVHHLHDLLTATNKVSKCSFSTKSDIAQISPRVPWGGLFARSVREGMQALAGDGALTHDRGDLSLTRNVVLWGANLAATSPALLRQLSAMKERLGERLQVFAVDPGVQGLPSFVRRIAIAPGSDRDLALALMLRIVGNPAAAAPRNVPEEPRYADADRGLRPLLEDLGNPLTDFVTHVRTEAATFLRMPGAGAPAEPDDALLDRCVHPRASAEAAVAPFNARFRADFEALHRAYLEGPTATILGGGPGRHLDGEEHAWYVAALAFLSGNVGIPGGGVSSGEDRTASFNTPAFAAAHDSLRPDLDTAEMGSRETQEAVNLASLGPDAPERTRVAFWFDADPLTLLPDPERVEELLGANRLNVQIAPALDDSSRYADVILPLADTLQSYDLQTTPRSPWINLTQPVRTPTDEGPRPWVRVLHEVHQAIRAKLADEYQGDLEPVIDRPVHRLGPVVLPADRRAFVAEFLTGPGRITDALRDRLPFDEANHMADQIRRWYEGVHGGEPRSEAETGFTVGNAVGFFGRVQVDWIVELLLARHTETEVALLLYNLLQRGTALDPTHFADGRMGVRPEGATPRARSVFLGSGFLDLGGTDGFPPSRAAYRDGVRAVDAGAHGRASFPMRMVVGRSPTADPTRIPLAEQVDAGAARPAVVVLNPASPSVAARALVAGSRVAVVGNVSYAAGQVFETVLARATVAVDPTMALETLWMAPGWHGLDRGGQRVARGIHSEEGETPALFDNLVRIEDEGYAPSRPGTRGQPPPKA